MKIEEYLWTFNMPTDHPRVVDQGRLGAGRRDLGRRGPGPAASARASCTRTASARRPRRSARRSTASNESVKYARARKPFGKPLSDNQAIQWPLIELHTQCEMLRLLIRKTAWEIDRMPHKEVERQISDKVSMCNYWANRLCCEAADRAMQVHGGIGYSRHKPFEHIYRHHRRYRITEGSEEIQMRKVGAFLFGYMGPRRKAMSNITWDDVDYRLHRRASIPLPLERRGSGVGGCRRRRVAERDPHPTASRPPSPEGEGQLQMTFSAGASARPCSMPALAAPGACGRPSG